MKRVASLWLPHWPIDRLRQAERPLAERHSLHGPQRAAADLAQAAEQERVLRCDAPKNTGWRPGARWARGEAEARIAALPAHQRPPLREMGRRSEAAEMPFKRLPGDDGSKSSGWNEPQPSSPSPFPPLARRAPSLSHREREGAAKPRKGEGDADTIGRPSPTAGLDPSTAPRQATPEARHPDPRPLVTVHKIGARVQIAAASPAAHALGLAPGMALTQARAAVPNLEVRDADPDGDHAALLALATLLARRWAPGVALSGDDGLFVDLTGVAHLHGGEARFARRLVRLLARRGIAARIAVADTTGAAWALARHVAAPIALIPPGEHPHLLAPLPVAALRIDDAATELLSRLGVDTIGQLAGLPRGPLVRRFGKAVAARLDQALGGLAEPIDPIVPAEPMAVTQRFAEPIATPEAIAHWLGELVARLAAALAEAGEGARLVEFVGARVDNVPQTLRIGLARATRDPAHLLKLIVRRIEEIDPGYGLDALTLHVRRADPLGPQPFDERLGEDAPDLAPLIDQLANRIGDTRLWRSAPVESDVPERSVAAAPPLDPPGRPAPELKRDDVRRLDRRVADQPWHQRWPRPVRLLRRPELLDHVLAELPDQPPRRFTWRGATHRVVRADGPERIAGEWWTRASEGAAIRDYFQVEDEAGARFWLFRRGDGVRPETGDLSWYMHGAMG